MCLCLDHVQSQSLSPFSLSEMSPIVFFNPSHRHQSLYRNRPPLSVEVGSSHWSCPSHRPCLPPPNKVWKREMWIWLSIVTSSELEDGFAPEMPFLLIVSLDIKSPIKSPPSTQLYYITGLGKKWMLQMTWWKQHKRSSLPWGHPHL